MTTTPRTWRRPAVALNLAGCVTFAAGLALTPWETEQTPAAYHDALAAHPEQAQAAALVLHTGYLLFAAGAFALIGVLGAVRGWWLRAGMTFTVLGATTMPGLLITDAYDLALAQQLPRDQSAAISEAVGELWLAGVLGGTAMLGLVLGMVALWTAAWRAGLVRGTVPALVLGGWIVGFATIEPAVMIAGAGLLTAAIALAARELWPSDEPQAARTEDPAASELAAA